MKNLLKASYASAFYLMGVLLINACCFPDDIPTSSYKLKRFLRLKDTNDVISEIRYKQSDIILHPGTNQGEFPVSENITTTAYIKRQNKNKFDTLELNPYFELQHIDQDCNDDRIRRTNPKFTITSSSLKEVIMRSMTDQNNYYEVFIID